MDWEDNKMTFLISWNKSVIYIGQWKPGIFVAKAATDSKWKNELKHFSFSFEECFNKRIATYLSSLLWKLFMIRIEQMVIEFMLFCDRTR